MKDDNKGADRILAARGMRINPTPTEAVLWDSLRNRKLLGLRFYRQRVIGPTIVDFYCAAAKLIVEVDGDIHLYKVDYDQNRTKYLEACGYQIIRFSNEMVTNNLESVLSQIKYIAIRRIKNLTPCPLP